MVSGGTDMYTGDAYLAKNPGYHLEDAGWKAALILAMMQKNNITPSTITDIGCGAGGVIKALAKSLHANLEFTGYDISPHAIAMCRESAPPNVRFETGDFFEETAACPDLALVIDVVEHLDNYYEFLRQLRTKTTRCIFHIPLDLSSRSVLKPQILKQQRDSVGHLHYFTRDMVWWMLEDAGFMIKDWSYTRPVTDIAASPTMFRKIKKTLRNISFGISQDLSAKLWGDYSVLILAE